MKRVFIITLTIFAAGYSFSGENYRKNGPVHVSQAQYKPLPTEKIGLGLRRTPQPGDSISAILDKAPNSSVKVVSSTETIAAKQSHLYLRLNVTEPNPGNRRPLMPGLGLGFRKMSGSSALDFSAAYSKRKGKHHGKSEWITLPKMSYLYYFSPVQTQSVYAGPGVAYGRIKRHAGDRFQGLIPSASIGYEISRKANLLSFLQLDVSLPLIATKRRGHLPGLMAEFAFGAGF